MHPAKDLFHAQVFKVSVSAFEAVLTVTASIQDEFSSENLAYDMLSVSL